MARSFGERLRALRKKAGLTQSELSYLIGVHETTIRRWEVNAQNPSLDVIKKLAGALHVSEGVLLSDEDGENSGWVLTVKMGGNFEEVIDMTKGVPRIASITTNKEGGFLCLGGSYELWTDDNNFKKIIQDLKKFRGTVIQNGIALGGVKA